MTNIGFKVPSCASKKLNTKIFVRPECHIKNYSSNAIRSYWTEFTNIQIACKVYCCQECHLFIIMKHPHLPVLSRTKCILHTIRLTCNLEFVLLLRPAKSYNYKYKTSKKWCKNLNPIRPMAHLESAITYNSRWLAKAGLVWLG